MSLKFSKANIELELDEAYVGGRRSGKRGRGAKGKTIVMGMAERHLSFAGNCSDNRSQLLSILLSSKVENYISQLRFYFIQYVIWPM
jgi:ISXO2-like transposase domain